jgi:hypothetical protein
MKLNKGDVYISNDSKEVCGVDNWAIGFFPLDRGQTLHKRKEDIKKSFDVGDKIEGFCNGYFGRDDYSKKTCVFSCMIGASFIDDQNNLSSINYNLEDSLFWSMVECWRID